MKCEDVKKLNWIDNKKERIEVQEHISKCSGCNEFISNYDSFMNVLKKENTSSLNIYASIQPKLTKTDDNVVRFPQKAVPFYSMPKVKWAIPVAASLIFAVFMALYINIGEKPGTPISARLPVQKLDIKPTNDGILLSWKDSQKSEYTVLRSTNPCDFAHAKQIKVKGNTYLDREPVNSPIVFYKVL